MSTGGGTRKGASRKKELALALCVSLWMAGGSVAAAADLYINAADNEVKASTAVPVEPSPAVGSTATDKTLSVTGGDWSEGNWSIYGGKTSVSDVDVTGYTLVLDGVKNIYEAVGAKSRLRAIATGNTIRLINSIVESGVIGGASDSQTSDRVTNNKLYLSGVNSAANVRQFQFIYIQDATWGTPVLTLNDEGIRANSNAPEYATIDTGDFAFSNPEAVVVGTPMNLIDATNTTGGIKANYTASDTTQEYSANPVMGVTIDAVLKGGIGGIAYNEGKNALVYTATENKATKLTFTDVEWKDSGALLDHAATLTNISFNGADVDTTKIHFKNLNSLLDAGKKMTLVSSFGDTVGTITGEKYTVGTTLEGKGKASLVGNDLIFTAETAAGNMTAQEQTHNTVMGAEVGMAALSAGNDFVGTATEGLALAANVGADGVSSFAQMGGGSIRQETGSHIDAHTWNAIIALGHQNKKERGTMEYGVFFEYGTGNYTTYNDDNERGDGNTHYTGGGLLAKYTMKNSVYVEGSLRAGSVHDDARNVLRDVVTGTPYSYETDAPYLGFHLGVGREIPFDDMHSLDVYGKYFYNRRNGVSFDAGGHYDLDAVTSSVIRVGARYNVKRDKWNYYGGVAYEHELDGKATGTADGVAIRAAETKGGSFRGEIGATMKPDENSPWSLDLNVSGFAGKKQGFTGGVSVAFMF